MKRLKTKTENKYFGNKLVKDIACEYWLRTLRGSVVHDNGDHSKENDFAMFLADFGASKNKPTQEQLDIFKKEFYVELDSHINKWGWREINIYCDYAPGLVIGDAAEKAGINDLCFPFKTGITLRENAIIECKPYSQKTEFEKIIYCEKSYIDTEIKYCEDAIKEHTKELESEKCLNRDLTRRLLEHAREHLIEWLDFSNRHKHEDFYVRKDFEEFVKQDR